MLGADDIRIELAGEAFVLRPSLRASTRLVQRHGLNGLAAAVRDFDLIVIGDLLEECGVTPAFLERQIEASGLASVRTRLAVPLAKFVLALAGIDPDAPADQPAPSGPSIPAAAYHARLFQIATGWLGWSATGAWNATAAEIIAAKTGRTDMIIEVLAAVFGGTPSEPATQIPYTSERLAKIEADGFDPAFDRSALQALKARQ